ncbi:MAG: hypothetical protein AAF517_19105, partial [Planctomycetota bacterium]
ERTCRTESPESKKLLLSLILQIDEAELLREVLAHGMLPAAGPEITSELLVEITDRDRRNAVEMLCTITLTEVIQLRRIASTRLLALAINPLLLAKWAQKSPKSMLDPRVFEKVVGRLGSTRISSSFKEYFRRATTKQALSFIDKLDPKISGTELVVLCAIEHGSTEIKKSALASLHRFANPTVVTTLIEIVKRNNYQARPNLDEVEGALRALVKIGAPDSQNFLREVSQKKEWLRHTYTREIRSVLEQITESPFS